MKLESRTLETPDQQRESAHGVMNVVTLDAATVVQGVLQPGWRWSVDLQPSVGGDSCQVAHTSYIISGRFAIAMDDGAELEVGPGDAVTVPPGHDAWVVGDQPCLLLDFAPAPISGSARAAACPCGVEFRIADGGDDAQLEHLIAAVQQHASGSHGHHEVTREHILGELIPA